MKRNTYGEVKLRARSYLTNRWYVANCLQIFNTWWTISNSKKRFSPNILRDDMINGERKTEFLRALADWIEQWCQPPAYTVFSQPVSALTTILRDDAILIDDLLNEAYVITARLQSDPADRHFSQYRRMSGGRFLVNLREALISEGILWCFN